MTRLLDGLERAATRLAAALLAAMVAMLAFGPVQALLGLGSPQAWLQELAEYGLLQLGFLGSAVALRRGAHPTLDLLGDRLPGPVGRATGLAADAAVALLGLALLALGTRYVLAAQATGGVLDTLPLPKWPFYLCYPAGGAAIALFALDRLRAGRSARGEAP